MSNASGYVHNLSPKKKSKKGMKYFDFQLETNPQSFARTVCFDSSLHDSFNEYMASGTPIKLKNVQRRQSLFDANQLDIIVNKRTKLEEASNADIQFEAAPPAHFQPQRQFYTVRDVADLEQGDNVCIKGLLTADKTRMETVNKNGSTYRVLRGSITDNTGTIRVRLWDSHCDHPDGTAYTFLDLKVREFNGQKTLTTSPSTTVTQIDEEFPHPDEDDINDLVSVRVDHFQMVNNYTTWFTCLNCSKHLTDVPTLKSAKCNNCKSIMMLDACPRKVSVRLAIPDPDHPEQHIWLTAFRDVLASITPNLLTGRQTEDEVIQTILGLQNILITFDTDTNIVRSIDM